MFTYAGARVNAGFTQEEAAKKMGMSKQALSQIELYKVKFPTLRTYIKMCNLYGVEPKDLEWTLERNKKRKRK